MKMLPTTLYIGWEGGRGTVLSILTASQGKNYIIFFLFSGKAEKKNYYTMYTYRKYI